jgi:predicted NBD/HSP70 family sugar kinase/antitoxin (DNA-binding transcriptional repressor) of toxin-antitoxin stability system
MKTITVRELSGELIAAVTAQEQILGITNMGALVGVLVPLTREVLQQMAIGDAADVRRSAAHADQELESGRPMSTLSELLDDRGEPGRAEGAQVPSPVRVTIRELSGARLERAGRLGEILLVTSGRVTIALLIPVTRTWLEQLVESGVRRFINGDAHALAAESAIPATSPAEYADVPGVAPAVPAVGLLTPRHEVPPQPTISGREINLQRAIGIRIVADPPEGQSRLHGVVTDMLVRPVAEPITRELASMDKAEVYATILELIDDLREYIDTEERLIGVGLEIGGHVDGNRVIYSPNAHWGDFPLADRLNAALGLPVVLENDANALAIRERRFDGVPDDNLAVILLTDVGIGAGFVLNGRVFRGIHGLAGEIGHVPLGGRGDDEAMCRCGNFDCLECAVTPRAIDEALNRAGFKGGYRAALELTAAPDSVKEEFEFAGSALGRAVATVIDLLNLSTMVFYGPPELLGSSREFRIGADPRGQSTDPPSESRSHPYFAAMIQSIRNHTFSTGASDCRFIIRSSADALTPQAAAACIINRILPTSRVLEGSPVMVQAS